MPEIGDVYQWKRACAYNSKWEIVGEDEFNNWILKCLTPGRNKREYEGLVTYRKGELVCSSMIDEGFIKLDAFEEFVKSARRKAKCRTKRAI